MDCHVTALMEKEGDRYYAYCPEISGVYGQGEAPEACIESIRQAIALVFEDRRNDARLMTTASRSKWVSL